MTTIYHKPVMVDEIVRSLKVETAHLLVDCTCGDGGHSLAILEKMPALGKVIALDRDEEALARARSRLAAFSDRIILVQGNFSQLSAILQRNNIAQVDAILADLGISFYQISTPERGFMFSADGPLLMQMGQDCEQSAFELINESGEQDLSNIIKEYGEERQHRRIARAIIQARTKKPIESTAQLTAIIKRAAAPQHVIKTLARVYQALRITINSEVDNLKSFLPQAVQHLKSKGRFAVLSYHSIEDRIMKNFIQQQSHPCTCPPEVPYCVCGKVATLKIVDRLLVPSAAEIAANSNARSARLRIAEKL